MAVPYGHVITLIMSCIPHTVPERYFSTNPIFSTSAVSTVAEGPDNIIIDPKLYRKCELEPYCIQDPVCGSDCQIYPSSCYLSYEACIQNKTISEVPFSDCLKQHHELEIEELPENVNLLYGDSVQFTCSVKHGYRPHRVLWYEIRGAHKIPHIISTHDTINITNVKQNTAYFCQVANCKDQIVQSNTVHVQITENVCLVYGVGHVFTFSRTTYTFQSDCTYVAGMDCVKGTWFVYIRFAKSWQIQAPTLSTVTFYYNYVPIEIQRGWIINYFGKKTVVKENKSMAMFGMKMTFDGLYLKVHTPEVTLFWDGIGSLIISVKPGDPTCGLCGSNTPSSSANSLRPRHGNLDKTRTIPSFVRSWALNRNKRCKYGTYPVDTSNSSYDRYTQCDIQIESKNPEINRFFQNSCKKDSGLPGRMVGDIPLYCWSRLALYQFRDKRHNSIMTRANHASRDTYDVCDISVIRRQYLAYFVGCPNSQPPFQT